MPGDGPREGPGSAPRIRRPRDVRRVLEEGTRLRSERVIVFLAPGPGPSRAAWIAGRRAGGAVERNRARRLLREAWWRLAPMLRNGYHLVLVARRPFGGAGASHIAGEVEELLEQAGVMRG